MTRGTSSTSSAFKTSNPSMSGIWTSRKTMSGAWAVIASMASRPFRASPRLIGKSRTVPGRDSGRRAHSWPQGNPGTLRAPGDRSSCTKSAAARGAFSAVRIKSRHGDCKADVSTRRPALPARSDLTFRAPCWRRERHSLHEVGLSAVVFARRQDHL